MSTKSKPKKKLKHIDARTMREIDDGTFIPSKLGKVLQKKEVSYTGAYLARCKEGGYRIISKDELDGKTDMSAILKEHFECMNEIQTSSLPADAQWQEHQFLIKLGDTVEVTKGITQEMLFKADVIFDIDDVKVLKNRFGRISQR